jgi:predicted ester cyclase
MAGLIAAAALTSGMTAGYAADDATAGTKKVIKKTTTMKSSTYKKSTMATKMTPEYMKGRIESFYKEVVNGKDLSKINTYVTQNFKENDPMPGMADTGPEAVRASFAAMFKAFPDLTMNLQDTVVQDNKIVARARMQGTQQGEFMGVQPTGKKIDVEVIDWVTVNEQGMATEHWGLTDTATMMQQLGQQMGHQASLQ